MKRSRPTQNTALDIALPAIIAALLLAAQLALRVIPNVEVVTLIIIVCSCVFSLRTVLLAVLTFCTGQWFIYGFGYWVPAYYLYWPALALVSSLLKKIDHLPLCHVMAVIIAVVCTALFGVITTGVEAIIVKGVSFGFFRYFAIVYARGIYFYIVHVVANLIIVSLLFTPLRHTLKNYAR